MLKIILAGLLCALPAICEGPRASVPLDRGWEFYPMPDFTAWPAEARLTAEQIHGLHCPAPGKGWQRVDLPHDYVVSGEFSPEPNRSLLAGGAVCTPGGRECGIPGSEKASGKPGALNRPGRNSYGGHGYLPVYPAWYRRSIEIPASAKGRSVWLDFGGVYRDAVVFVNGRFIEEHPSGYTGFRLNVTSVVRPGEKNEVAVFVDPRWFEGWFYEGGGIYRHVRLIVADRLQVAPWGTFVEAEGPALTVETTVRNDYPESRSFTLVSQAMDPAGKTAGSVSTREEIAAGKKATFTQHVRLREARLWSLEQPNLYKLATAIRVGDRAVDEESTEFGIRSIRFDPERGFFLNGKHVEIHGVCAHQGFPGVGIAAADNLWAWRIAKLKAMGANAYRGAHNPVSEAFYEAADRMGMLVMDENRHLGDTYWPSLLDGTGYSDLSDAKAMVLQHRNHPSIVMWSLCNEGGCKGSTPYGATVFAATKAAVKSLDPTRPTTSAVNGGYAKDGVLSVEDIIGMNYHNGEFAKNHATFPRQMIFGSEDYNSKTSRGTMESSRETGRCSQYGESQGCNGEPWKSWVPVVENPYVAGQFIWTGFDYRGEPNPYSWPAVTSQTGAMDLAGFPKPVYYYWQIAWQKKPAVYIFPDWNAYKPGTVVTVRAFSNCARVELRLNSKSLGAKDMPKNMYLDWPVPYAPGTLTAIGYNGGVEAAQYAVQTTGVPAKLRLVAQVSRIAANGEDIAPVAVEVVDAEGRVVPTADNLIRFSVAGAGTVAGVANGDPASHESNVGSERRAFHGLAMVLVRAGERAGAITVEAEAAGLAPAKVAVEAR